MRNRVVWGGEGHQGAHAHQFWCAWAQQLSRYSIFHTSANTVPVLEAAVVFFFGDPVFGGAEGVPKHLVDWFPRTNGRFFKRQPPWLCGHGVRTAWLQAHLSWR
jgi:hypothetical protein